MKQNRTITKILIANRGEIACRIIKTAKQLGITTVSVYSDIDANALHVRMADEAYCLGEAPSQESYLNQKKLLSIAKQAKVSAIHPGYGFLSENPEFAKCCEEQHIIFIGPSSEVIALMGDKHHAKQVMAQAQVPIIPGYSGDKQTISELYAEAIAIGFPLMIKASAGGGGKGMRLVHESTELKPGLESAKREALASFGNDTLILEKYLFAARHIEVQILCDQYDNVMYLFDRECSIQRRHQKVIEEAPAPEISDSVREQMALTAIKAAKAIHYRGAGTIEFLLDQSEQFYFMEMNTRLQVEHAVTEMICQLDLVAWQIAIANGVQFDPDSLHIESYGHAIEARLYAEDPTHDFLPDSGQIDYLKFPAINQHLRIDTGIEQGSYISIYYDPLLAKIIVWHEERERAVIELQRCLNKTQLIGIKTNLALLCRLAEHPDFMAGHVNTYFIPQHQKNLLKTSSFIPISVLMAASFALWHNTQVKESNDLASPWQMLDGWRAFEPAHIYIALWDKTTQYQITLTPHADYFIWYWQNQLHYAKFVWHADELQIILLQPSLQHPDTPVYQQYVQLDLGCFSPIILANQLYISYKGELFKFVYEYPSSQDENKTLGPVSLTAPMPGVIIQICVTIGQKVHTGDPLVVLEAMKMEHILFAPYDGQVTDIFYNMGERVNNHDPLIALSE